MNRFASCSGGVGAACLATAALALSTAACGGSETVDSDVTSTAEATTTIDLADGALVRNDAASSGDPGSDPGTSDATTGTEPAGGADDGGAAGSTTSDASSSGPATSAADATTAPTGGGGADDDGAVGSDESTAADASNDATTGGATSDGATTGTSTAGGAGTAGPNQGVITVDGVSYRYEARSCIVTPTSVLVGGVGTTDDGARFQAAIIVDEDDVDADGTLDLVLDVIVDLEPTGGAAEAPSFYATKVDAAGEQEGASIEYRIDGARISGTGTIVDDSGIAAPPTRELSLTFDADCT